MRKLILFVLVFSFVICNSQKMITKTGVISFDGSVPTFEPVKGTNESVTCVLETSNGKIASLALVKGFRFKVALMEEHFNENYIESDKFPKAKLKGQLIDFNVNDLTESPKEYSMTGNIELHGVKKDINIKAFLSKSKNGIILMSNFIINASDFNITIPSFVKSKLTNVIKVKVEFTLM